MLSNPEHPDFGDYSFGNLPECSVENQARDTRAQVDRVYDDLEELLAMGVNSGVYVVGPNQIVVIG